MTFDVAIIGGGIVGVATAHELVRGNPPRTVVVLEKEWELASHQTGRSSGVVHAGLYYKPGSRKATLCVEGRKELVRFCEEHGVPFERTGKLVVATEEEELPRLAALEERGRANGLAVQRVAREAIQDYEPHAAGLAAIHVPETGILDFAAATRALARAAEERGAEVRTGALVAKIARDGELVLLETTRGTVRARTLVNCAGLQSDRVARLAGDEPEVRIVPFRGDYFELVPARRSLVRGLVYPVPDPRFPFLGVHLTKKPGGAVEAGPSAVLSLAREGYTKTSVSLEDAWSTLGYGGFWAMAKKYYRTGFGEVWRAFHKPAFVHALQRLVPSIGERDLMPAEPGIRAQALDRHGALVDDFSIVKGRAAVHVLNAPSPAATASMAIARHVAELVRAG